MGQRTTRHIAVFAEPFSLESVGDVMPAGAYAIEQQEELIESASWQAFRKVAVHIHLPAIGAPAIVRQLAPISEVELAFAAVRPAVDVDAS